jgi:hypothetical protein
MRLTVPACSISSRTAPATLLFRRDEYVAPVEPGQAPHDRHPGLEQLHGVPTDRRQDEERAS